MLTCALQIFDNCKTKKCEREDDLRRFVKLSRFVCVCFTCFVGEGATSRCLGTMQRVGGTAHHLAQRSKQT